MCEQTEGIGVTFEVRYVVPESAAYHVMENPALTLSEECLDSLFARMSKRRVAHVVGKAGCGNYLTDFG